MKDKIIKLGRLFLTAIIIFGVYVETGPVTAACITLIAISLEISSLLTKEITKDIGHR